MYEIGSYVYLRKGATLHDPKTTNVLHAVPRDWGAAVSVYGPIEIRNGQPYVPVSNPFSTNVPDPVNPYRTDDELGVVLVHTSDIRDPEEVVGAMLPAVAGGGWKLDARTGAITKADLTSAIDKGTWVALALTAGITALLAFRNPNYKYEILAAGMGLTSAALYVNLNRQTWGA